MPSHGNGRSGYGSERHWPPAGTHVVQLLFMHVPAEDVAGVSGRDALLGLRRTTDVDPVAGSCGAGVHEENVVISEGEWQAAEKGALLFAELVPRPRDGGLRIDVQ